ncbi:MAG: hypothetical protein KDA24_07210 [Deltaproteobacteria bacterium]|nr:hypothetical protein [Deltaproteobacteria bacterium]
MQKSAWLLSFAMLCTACSPGGRGGGSGFSSDDDDSGSDDDDSSSPDDDDATSDDDDATSDDDDDATSDDDDATSDDDDATSDDDDATSTGYPWEGDAFCLDWSSVTWVSPSAGVVTTLSGLGFNVTDSPLLLSPLSVVGSTIDVRLAAATANTCNQDISLSTADESGSWSEPTFDFGPTDLTLPLVVGSVSLYDVAFDGDISSTGTQITGSSIEGELQVPSLASSACTFVLTCFPCSGDATADCIDLDVQNATWNNVGAGPLLSVP